MSYSVSRKASPVDTNIYNEENLTEDEQDEIKYWRDVFVSAAENVIAEYDDDTTVIGRMRKEMAQEVIGLLHENIEASIKELMVSFIDNRE